MQNRKLDEYQLSGAGRHKQVVLKKDLVEYRRKKQAIKHLMRDKEMAAELIQLYAVNERLVRSQRKLAGMRYVKQPR